MRKQCELGPIDFVTGDWLAENNIAQEAAAMDAGKSEGFKPNSWQALQLSMDIIARKRIKVVINGGALGQVQQFPIKTSETMFGLIVAIGRKI